MSVDAAASTHAGSRWKPAAAALLVLLVALAYMPSYVPAYRAGFIWDDDEWLLDNPSVRATDGLERIWLKPTENPHYYPLVFSTFWAEYHLWGYEPLGYHAVNVLLHALNALLVWRVLKRLRVPAAWAAAALFAVHPVHVESVAWVTERKNVLSLFFALLSLHAYLRFRSIEPDVSGENARAPSWAWYAVAFACFFLAMTSKTVVVALPPAILVLIWWKRGRIAPRDALELVPFFALGLFFSFLTIKYEAPWLEAHSEMLHFTFLDRCGIAGRALWFYASKLLWPYPLTAVYPRWDVDASVSPALLLYPLCALGAFIALWFRRESFGRGALAAALIFAGSLFPVLGFFNHSTMSMTFVADHYQYHASVALLALMAAAAHAVLVAQGEHALKLGAVAGMGLLAGLGALSFSHALDFQNQSTLWAQNLDQNPDSWPAHFNLAADAARAGKTDEALDHYREAARIRPRDGNTFNNLACVLLGMGRVDAAAAEFAKARELRPQDAEIRNNLGRVLLRLGKLDEAQAEFEEAVRLSPTFAVAHSGLGDLLVKKGNLDAAIESYRKALSSAPGFVEAHYGMAGAYYRQKKFDEAAGEFAAAAKLMPTNVRAIFGLARCLEHLGKNTDAEAFYREILRLDPQHEEAAKRLKALEQKGPEKEP